MKRDYIIIIGIMIIAILVIVLTVLKVTNNQKETIIDRQDVGNIDNTSHIPTASEIEVNSSQYINQLENVRIKGTNDTIMITEKVKWDVPEHAKGTTVSYSVLIPYVITVDGLEYKGEYVLGGSSQRAKDENPKYDFEVTNLTKNGDIEVLITYK